MHTAILSIFLFICGQPDQQSAKDTIFYSPNVDMIWFYYRSAEKRQTTNCQCQKIRFTYNKEPQQIAHRTRFRQMFFQLSFFLRAF